MVWYDRYDEVVMFHFSKNNVDFTGLKTLKQYFSNFCMIIQKNDYARKFYSLSIRRK